MPVKIVKDVPMSRITKCQYYGEGMFAGVCSGIAKYFHVNVTLLRILWFLSCFFFGVGVLAYIFMNIILKDEQLK